MHFTVVECIFFGCNDIVLCNSSLYYINTYEEEVERERELIVVVIY